MSKKLLALSAICALGAASVQAKVTGFYVGVSGGFTNSQFKLKDCTTHTGATNTYRVEKGAEDSYAWGYGFTYTGDNPVDVTLTVVPTIIGSQADLETSTPWKGMQPTLAFNLGYNYAIGSNFMVGFELQFGKQFKSVDGEQLYRPKTVNQYGTQGGFDYKEATGSDCALRYETTDEDSYYRDMRDDLSLKAEWKNRYFGDAFLRFGVVVPMSDGHFIAAVKGGIGFTRQELGLTSMGAGAYYHEAATQAGNAQSKVDYKNAAKDAYDAYIKKVGTASDKWGSESIENESEHFARYIAARRIQNSFYYSFLLEDGSKDQYVSEQTDQIDEVGAPSEEFKNAADDVMFGLLDYMKTRSHGLTDDAKANAKTCEMGDSVKKTRFTWSIGADLEYMWHSGLFVRASYLFKHINGMTVEKSCEMKGVTETQLRTIMKSKAAGRFMHDFILNATTSDKSKSLINENPGADKPTREQIIQEMIGYIQSDNDISKYWFAPENGASAGTLNYKFEQKKAYSHSVSFGLGYKFF